MVAVENGELELTSFQLEGLARNWRSERRKAALLELEWERVSKSGGLAQFGLPRPILLKGAAVSRFYRKPACRAYVDMDLMVPHARLFEFANALRVFGYLGPGGWAERHQFRYQHHVVYRRRVDGISLTMELHTSLSMERRVRLIDYEALVRWAQPSDEDGLLWLDRPAQFLVTALHLARHSADNRRLVWVRDLIEIGNPSTVAEARSIAETFEVSGIFEAGLAHAEDVLQEPIWNAVRGDRPRFGLAAMAERRGAGVLVQLALARELGVWDGLRYLFDRFNPRQFVQAEGHEPPLRVRDWVRALAKQLAATRWVRARTDKK